MFLFLEEENSSFFDHWNLFLREPSLAPLISSNLERHW